MSLRARLRRYRWAIALVAAASLLLGIGAAASWHFSSAVLVPDHSRWPEEVRVEAVSPGRIVLPRSEDTIRPGYYGLDWQAGHAVIGPVLANDGNTVTRRLEEVRGYLVPGTEVGLDTNVYSGNPRTARGLPFSTVGVDGQLGRMPAWRIPGRTKTWAIVVHGINGDPQIGLRLAPELRHLGFPSLLITYREDLGAPSSPDGFHHMGLTEWQDLEAAARYALAHGAHRLVLIGYSMGGSLVTQFIQHSALASRVSAVVLDAPALNWKKILEFNASEKGFPSIGAVPVEWAIGARIDADWNDLDALQHPDDFHLPILLFHGLQDGIVPIETSDNFAAELPRWVTYYRVAKAGHTQSWNVNPALYERRLQDFLSSALKTSRARPVGSGSKK